MMEEKPEVPPTAGYVVVVPDAPELPLLHVNALNVRFSVDEFFLTLGVIMPPEFRSIEEARQAGGQLTAQPVFRFALSQQTMVKFVQLMQAQLQVQNDTIEHMIREQEAHLSEAGQKREESDHE